MFPILPLANHRRKLLIGPVAVLMSWLLPLPVLAQKSLILERVPPEVLDTATSQEQLSLIVYLTEQPGFEIAHQEQAARLPILKEIASQLEQLMLPFGVDEMVPEPTSCLRVGFKLV